MTNPLHLPSLTAKITCQYYQNKYIFNCDVHGDGDKNELVILCKILIMTTQDCCYNFLYLSTPQPFHHTCFCLFCWFVQQACFYWLPSFLFPVVFHSCAILSPLFICFSCLLSNFNIYVVLMLYISHLLDNLLQLHLSSLLSCWFISTWFYFDRFKNKQVSVIPF